MCFLLCVLTLKLFLLLCLGSVRTRALLALDQCTSSASPFTVALVRGIITPKVSDRPAAPIAFKKTPDCYSVVASRQSGKST